MPILLAMLHPLDLQQLLVVCLALIWLAPFAAACSSRAIPKVRPTTMMPAAPSSAAGAAATTTARPNVTFPILDCPATYDAWYCLNDATCFAVEIQNEILYNCECANGYMGPRCEYKEIDGSYFPARHPAMLKSASIATGVVLAVFMAVVLCCTLYVRYEKKTKQLGGVGVGGALQANGHDNPVLDEVDGMTRVAAASARRPFGPHHYNIRSLAEVLRR